MKTWLVEFPKCVIHVEAETPERSLEVAQAAAICILRFCYADNFFKFWWMLQKQK